MVVAIGGGDGDEFWEAFRLLGLYLRSLEDFTAHDSWTEVALRSSATTVFFDMAARP